MVLSIARVDGGKFNSFQKKDAVLPGQSNKHLILQCLFLLRPERPVRFFISERILGECSCLSPLQGVWLCGCCGRAAQRSGDVASLVWAF